MDLTSVQHIISQLQQNTAGADAVRELTLGVYGGYAENEEFHTALGISIGTTTLTVTNAAGQNWTITLEFN